LQTFSFHIFKMKPLLVRDLMTVGVPTCKTTTPITEVARFLIDNNIDELVVLGEEGEGVGVCGYEQLVSAYSMPESDNSLTKEDLCAEDIMSEGVPEIPADITLQLAAQLMNDNGIRVAYMNHNSAGIIYPAALISFKHLVRQLAARDESELKDLGLRAERKSPIEVFQERREKARKQAGLT
jgi:CBS domain-containing protein